MKFMAGLKLEPLSGRRSRSWALLTNLTESAGKEDPALNSRPIKLPVGAGGRQGGGMYLRPKDSNAAVGVLLLPLLMGPRSAAAAAGRNCSCSRPTWKSQWSCVWYY